MGMVAALRAARGRVARQDRGIENGTTASAAASLRAARSLDTGDKIGRSRDIVTHVSLAAGRLVVTALVAGFATVSAIAQVVGGAIAGLPGAIWADNNNDGNVDGYVYNGQYYAGTPATLRVSFGSPPPPRSAPAPVSQPAQKSVPVNGPIDRVSGLPIPIYSTDKIVPFDNGCAMIVPRESDYSGWVLRWYGGCKFGLAHGRGFFYAKKDDFLSAKVARFRHGIGFSPSSAAPNAAKLPAWLNGGNEEYVEAEQAIHRDQHEKPGESILDPYGNDANFIAATWQRAHGTRHEEDQLWIHKDSCYVATKPQDMVNALRGSPILQWPESLIAEIVPFCLKANQRLKAEGRMPVSADPNADWTPFDKVDYGYFFVVFMEHSLYDTTNLNPYGGANEMLPPEQRHNAITLCPQMDKLTSCESIWRPLEVPFVKRRDEIIQLVKAHDAEREQRFAPLEAAWHTKIAALVSTPEKAPESITKSTPKKQVKRKN